MRIVAGLYRSRVIKAVEGTHTRPTTDKIKEAVFSSIGPYFDGGVMLDLFAGSGNIGLEALSRGMDTIYFCDHHPRSINTIKANCASLQVQDACHVYTCDYQSMLSQMAQKHIEFDLIYLDPPYRKQRIHDIMTYISEHALLKKQGIVVAESLKEDTFADSYLDIYKRKDKTYGITRITIYERSL